MKLTETVHYTPGPWSHQRLGNYMLVEATGKHPIAQVYGLLERAEVCEADARLIAASPELLASLEEIRDMLSNSIPIDYKRDCLSAITIAIKAITKAGGGK